MRSGHLKRTGGIFPKPLALGSTNILSGLPSGTFTGVNSPFSFTAARVNDGVLLTSGLLSSTNFINTLNATAAANDGKGVEIAFGTPKRLGRLKLSCFGVDFGVVCDFKVEAFISGVWTQVGELTANTSPANFGLRDIDFNTGGLVNETNWRLTIANWSVSNSNNFYAGELQAFEYS